jgi:hypothetical protein
MGPPLLRLGCLKNCSSKDAWLINKSSKSIAVTVFLSALGLCKLPDFAIITTSFGTSTHKHVSINIRTAAYWLHPLEKTKL